MKKVRQNGLILVLLLGLSACSFSSDKQVGKLFVANQKTFVPGTCYENFFTDYGNQLINNNINQNQLIVYQDGISEILVFSPGKGIKIDVNRSSGSKVYLESDLTSSKTSFYLGRTYNPLYPKKVKKYLENPPKVYLENQELMPVITKANKDLVREQFLLNPQE